MSVLKSIRRIAILSVLAGLSGLSGSWTSSTFGQVPSGNFNVATLPPASATGPAASADVSPELGTLTGHPIEPALDIAYKGMRNIKDNIKDYTCILIKRERINGELKEPEYMEAKIRHEPFSVYLKFLKPADIAGREVIYVAGANDGNLIGHEGRGFKAVFGPMQLKPNSPMAMAGNKYPITEVGIKNLTKRLIEVAENDRKFGETEVEFKKATIKTPEPRECTMIQVTHPVPRKNFLFNVARIYVDNALNIPIRYEAYDWPTTPGGAPVLTEEYTYARIKLNQGLTDADFDIRNPAYNFQKRAQ
ncbi:MAG: DUF1571 domain-containing protein [Planctomycetota bacterium]|nr:DUF1571 domain-containing protein [Planctomycetota bacterium]